MYLRMFGGLVWQLVCLSCNSGSNLEPGSPTSYLCIYMSLYSGWLDLSCVFMFWLVRFILCLFVCLIESIYMHALMWIELFKRMNYGWIDLSYVWLCVWLN